MKKSVKINHTKAVVRNTEQPKPKSVVLIEPRKAKSENEFQMKVSNQPHIASAKKIDIVDSNFELPTLNSALAVAEKIQSVENVKTKKVKSTSDLQKKQKMFIDEKVAKKVNLPYNQQLYKDLIPVCVKSHPQSIVTVRELVTQKDIEPVLSDFFKPRVFPEYRYQVPIQNDYKPVTPEFDGLRLYRLMQTWT